MTNLLLHIGTGKTGTSSIQQALTRAENEGRFPQVVYPGLGAPNHRRLAAVYKAPERMPRMLKAQRRKDPDGFDAQTKAFRESLLEIVGLSENVILSSEYLDAFSEEEATALRDDLERAGVARVRVIAYVRDVASYYLSYVQQRLRASHTLPQPSDFRYHFLRALTRWSDLYPDVVARPYVRDRLLESDVVCDFLREAQAFFGVELPSDGLDGKEVNRSLSAEGMIVLQQYRLLHLPEGPNTTTDDTTRLVRILERSLEDLVQTTPTLRADVSDLVLRSHSDDLLALRERFGLDLLPGGSVAEGDPAAMSGIERVEDILAEHNDAIVRQLLLHVLGKALGRAVPDR